MKATELFIAYRAERSTVNVLCASCSLKRFDRILSIQTDHVSACSAVCMRGAFGRVARRLFLKM